MPSNEDASIKEKEQAEQNKDAGVQGNKEVEPNEAAGIEEKKQDGLNIDGEIQEKEHGELNKDAGIQEKEHGELNKDAGIQEKEHSELNKDAGIKENEHSELNKDAGIQEKDQVLLNKDVGIQEKEQNVLNIDSGQEMKEVILNEDKGIQDGEQKELNKDAGIQEYEQVVLNKDAGIQEKEESMLNIEAGIQEKEQIILNEVAGLQGMEQDTLSNLDVKNTEQLIIQPDIVKINGETDSLQTELKDLNTEAEKIVPPVSESIISTDNHQKQEELNPMQEKIDVAASGGLEIEKQELSETEGTIKGNIGNGDATVSSLPEGEVLQKMPEQSVPLKVDSLVGSLTYDRPKADETLYDWGAKHAQFMSESQKHNKYGDKTVETIADIGQHEQQLQKDDATHSTFDTLKTSSESSSEINGNLDMPVVPYVGSKGTDIETNTHSQASLDGSSLAPHAEVTSEIPTVEEIKSINNTPNHDHDNNVLGENVAEHENISESQESVEYRPNSSQETPEYNYPNDLQHIDNTASNPNANPEFTGSEADKELTDNTLAPVEQALVSEGETGTSNPDSESELVPTEAVDESRPQAVTSNDGTIPDTEDTGVMTYLSSFFSGMTGLFTSSKIEYNDHKDEKNLEEDSEHREDTYVASGNLDHPSCSADGIEDCANMLPTTAPDVFVDTSLPIEPTTQTQFTDELDHLPSGEITLYLIVTAITVLLFTLGHFFIEKSKQDAALVRKINSLEKSLLVSAKECALVTNELQATMERDTTDDGKDSAAVACLSEELEEKRRECAELEEQVANLQSELDAATDAGMDLNRMLTEFLSTQHSTNALMESVEQMQAQLDAQQGTIDSMDSLLDAKGVENENLQGELYVASDKIERLERDLNKATVSLSELLVGKAKQDEGIGRERLELQHQVTELLERRQAETDNFSAEIASLRSQVAQLKDSLAAKDRELAVTQECIAKLSKSSEFRGSNKVQDVIDVGRAHAELAAVKAQRDALVDELKEERGAIKFLDDHVKVISEEVESLRETCRAAEAERSEATMKLKVLSSYFEEKEMQLQKDLDMQEAISVKTTGDMSSTCELVGSLQEQMKSYRSQNETLKKEILDQERELKDQIAALERKAHENWVSARQAERKVEEMKQEAGQLRNLLTIAEKPSAKLNQSSDQVAMNDRLSMDVNGELPTSPLHAGMGLGGLIEMPLPYPPIMSPPTIAYPPPHLGGVPFMPPPTYSYDRRPPPLGCMSSPPLLPPPPPTTRHYSRHYEHHSPDRLSPDRGFRSGARGVPPPPSGPAGFRPFPRTSKGSNLSSDHSSGSLEK